MNGSKRSALTVLPPSSTQYKNTQGYTYSTFRKCPLNIKVIQEGFVIFISSSTAQLRLHIENSLVLCHLKSLRIYTDLLQF